MFILGLRIKLNMRGSVYIGTSLHNASRAQQLMGRFESENVSVTYDWTKHGQVYTEEELRKYGLAEKLGIKHCDVFFMIFPGRNGCHVELGLAIGFNKHIVLLEETEVERKTFYHLPGIKRFKTEEEAVQYTLQFLDSKPSLIQTLWCKILAFINKIGSKKNGIK